MANDLPGCLNRQFGGQVCGFRFCTAEDYRLTFWIGLNQRVGMPLTPDLFRVAHAEPPHNLSRKRNFLVAAGTNGLALFGAAR